MAKNMRRKIVIFSIAIIYLYNVLFDQQRQLLESLNEEGGDGKEIVLAAMDDKPIDPLNILVLGGSVTWGAVIKDRKKAYQFLLESEGHKVFDLAIRATGSAFPAQCIESMLKEKKAYDDDVTVDVILMEYSINGHDAFELLLLRLKERYPDALFIYIDLYSLIHGQMNTSAEAMKLTEDIGGIVYKFPRSERPEEKKEIATFFAGDHHHLSVLGHDLVKTNINHIIRKQGIVSKPKLGSWLGGDKCSNWFQSGQMNLNYTGDAELIEFDVEKQKYALEIKSGGAVIEYDYDGDYDASISFGYITKCWNWTEVSSVYPPVVVRIEQSEEKVEEAKDVYTNGEFQISLSSYAHVDSITDGWIFISGLFRNRARRRFHITESHFAGNVSNFIYVQPTNETPSPFRVVATIICEACKRLGWNHGDHKRTLGLATRVARSG